MYSLKRWSLFFIALLFIGQGCVSLGGSNNAKTSGPAGVFISVDKGEAWTHLTSLPEADGIKNIGTVSVYKLFDDPQDPNTMYLATRGQGLFYTYDNGKTWQRPNNTVLQNAFIYGVAVHPKDKCTIFVSNGNQVFRSNDCSRSWEEVYRESRAGVSVASIAFEQFSPNRLYMLENNGDVLQSLDGGQSWSVIKRLDGTPVHIETNKLEENTLYVTTRDEGIYRSKDAGANWTQIKDQFNKFNDAQEYRGFVMHPSKRGVLFWLSTYGILYSLDSGDTWQNITLITPPGSVNIYAFAVNPKNDQEMFYTATLKDLTRSTFYKSIDGGKNWTTKKLPSGQVPIILRPHLTADYIYLGFAVPPQK